jgi:hypothetical protein
VISANGRELFSGKVQKGRSRLVLPLDGVHASKLLDVRIKSKTFVPAESADSEDARELGIAIRAVRVMRECCLATHNPFAQTSGD